jgi:hypothetical protein
MSAAASLFVDPWHSLRKDVLAQAAVMNYSCLFRICHITVTGTGEGPYEILGGKTVRRH